MSGKISILETHEVRIAVRSEPECCLTLRAVEQFCEAMRGSGAEGTHEVVLRMERGGGGSVDSLNATVDQRGRPSVAREG